MNRCLQKMLIRQSHCHTKQRKLKIIDVIPGYRNDLDSVFKTNNNIVISDPRIYLNQHPIKGYKWDEGNRYSRNMYLWHLKKHDRHILEKWPLLMGETVLERDVDEERKYNTVITSVRFDNNEYLDSEIKQLFNTFENIDEKQRIIVITDSKLKLDSLIKTKMNQTDDDTLKRKLKEMFYS